MRIGIDLGGTKTEGIVMDSEGEVMHCLRKATPQALGYAAVLANIAYLVAELEQLAACQCTVGIATPGALSLETGLLINSNTTCLNGQPLQKDLQHLLGREVRIANDANCFALSEAISGAAQDGKVVFGIIIGTGTGAGIVVNKHLITGAQSIAGEWGHNPLTSADGPQGRACYCGRTDCVETYLSGSGLVTTWQGVGGEAALTAEQIVQLADDNNHCALTAIDQYLQHFARALASVINILDPDVVVLGGGLSNMPYLYTQLSAALKPHIFSDSIRTQIIQNQHGDSSGVRGAAWLWD